MIHTFIQGSSHDMCFVMYTISFLNTELNIEAGVPLHGG